jgi:hypothetical protein
MDSWPPIIIENFDASTHNDHQILPEKTVQVATFQVYLMLHISIKFDNTWTKMIT